MSNYLVKLDIIFLEYIEVDANSKAEAIEIAYRRSDYQGSIDSVFEVEKLSNEQPTKRKEHNE